ncbi:hypothetical protein Taro_006261 [Colocasia esculenta]|uniref:Transcription factor CBF/NF-Y/archaeal histone domain-containing protein n=1 Tax=Colocasia esculenta TaxID=4460 RepID=A0A843TS14_COLES|nr:hypothetical protein [Colocasia esculenta]
MDPANNNQHLNPFRHLPPHLQAPALPINVNEPNPYAAMHAPQAAFQPPALPIPLHQFAAMNMGNYNQAMLEVIRSQMHFFWAHQTLELNNVGALKQQLLPLARIKRVMKANPEVKMISADTPVLFSKACELFIMELSFRGWLFAEGSDRRTLEKGDVINAIAQANMLHFLSDLIP